MPDRINRVPTSRYESDHDSADECTATGMDEPGKASRVALHSFVRSILMLIVYAASTKVNCNAIVGHDDVV